MSELKEIGIRWEENGELHFSHVYPKSDVDEAIDKLKAAHHKERHEYIEMVAQLQQENRRLKRALWLVRVERANARKDYWYARSCHEGDKRLWSIDGSPVKYIGCIKRTNFDWLKIWSEVECKCFKKAEEYSP